MDALGAGVLRNLQDGLGLQIAFGSGRRADMDRLVRHLNMHRLPVGIRIDRDRPDAEAPRRLDDAAGDLAAIGDQDGLEHGRAVFPVRLGWIELLTPVLCDRAPRATRLPHEASARSRFQGVGWIGRARREALSSRR